MVLESHPPEPCRDIEIDASIVSTEPGDNLLQVVRDTATSRHPRDLNVMDDRDDLVVYKRGINEPHLTSGILDCTPEALAVTMPGSEAQRDYVRGYFVTGTDIDHPFARQGDSGSIVVDDDDCVVGLIVALQTANPLDPHPQDPAFVVAITDVLAALDIELLGPDRPCALG
jgi:hypothetical protein